MAAARRPIRPARSAHAGALRLIWIAVGLHAVGLVIDALFHEGHTRPFSVLDMLWAHGLAYVGAILTIVGGWRLWRATDQRLAYRVSGSAVAVLGVGEAIGLAIDLVTELTATRAVVGPTIYVLALGLAVVASVIATVLSRRPQPGPSAERGLRAWLLRNPAIITAVGALLVAGGTARIVIGDNSAATIYGAVQVIAGGWIGITGLLLMFRSRR